MPADLEEASSSHNMQVDAAALQEGPASSVSADSMQHEPWAVLADPPLTFMTSALMLPSLISVDADLDAYGSGVSSGMTRRLWGICVACASQSNHQKKCMISDNFGRNSANADFAK